MTSPSGRRPIVGGNWKMNTTQQTARQLAREVVEGLSDAADGCDVVLFPPFPYLAAVGEIIADSPIALGAQDGYPEKAGAFTGEVGMEMLLDLDVSHLLIGHSERRHVIREDSLLIHRKLVAAIDAGIQPVLCVGETLEQREAGETQRIVFDQLDSALGELSAEHLSRLIIAYEPVWAIGTGHTATPNDAQTVHEQVRQSLIGRYTESFGSSIRIQYGGSVKPDNAEALFAQPDVDGGLIGGASLKASDFLAIVRAAGIAD